MRVHRKAVHGLFLLLLPIIVAVFGLGFWSALSLVLLQRWIYQHILDDRELTLHAWGIDDGQAYLLGGDEPSYVDITMAAISGLWLVPEKYGAGRADATRPDQSRLPPTPDQRKVRIAIPRTRAEAVGNCRLRSEDSGRTNGQYPTLAQSIDRDLPDAPSATTAIERLTRKAS